MNLKANSLVILLLVALGVAGYGVYSTGRDVASAPPPTQRRARANRGINVDQSSLTTAARLVRLPTSADERTFADDALRIADQEMDLAFAQAVRVTALRAPAKTPESTEANTRVRQAQQAFDADQARVTDLTAATAKAHGAEVEAAADRLALAKAQLSLDEDQLDDAKADLIRAGGDPQGQMAAMVAEHDAASRASDSVRVNAAPLVTERGLIGQVQALQSLYQKHDELADAKAAADSLAKAYKQRHDRLEAQAAARATAASTGQMSHDSAAVLLAATRQTALTEKTRAALDQRVDNQQRLSDIYVGWIGVVGVQQEAALNRALRAIAAILAIILLAILIARWIEHALGARSLDRRRTQTLYMVTRVSLQVVAVLLILLVIFGPPNDLGTFLGLAGAGLTVALKDFIVAFIGWFVLMGRNGIRIGDLVEINDVTGEVVELGIFYTVLHETGGWNETGNQTGRRVSFTNGFAIEGHYFNFSTSGQWLWDDVQIVVPEGRDLYAIVDALQQQTEEATADSARQATEQWKGARHSPSAEAVGSSPIISLKPVGGGVEITMRYITRVTERAELRSRLYHSAVDLLGGSTPGMKTPSSALAPVPAAR